jgi:NAD(P) transhydrogenase
MKPKLPSYDLVVIGAGPAGQKAAVQGAKAGKRVLLVDRESGAGGECVNRGTIPSKTLRESAVFLTGLRRRAGALFQTERGPKVRIERLMQRLDEVLASHRRFMDAQIARNGIEQVQGRARFASPNELEIACMGDETVLVKADAIVIATGSRPRAPVEIQVDHEHVLDSDSILSLIYLPRSLLVLGAGVIACEFATIFQALGVDVTLADKGERPLAFLDPELTALFVASFEAAGGRFLPGAAPLAATFDGIGAVEVKLSNGASVSAEKVLVALGRTAAVQGLALERAGIQLSPRGFVPVDENCRTSAAGVYAAGDVIGPPALAASSMEQGRRAARHACGLGTHSGGELTPVGIYTLPEIASVGLAEAEARAKHGEVVVGRAKFEEIARGQINGCAEGLLKLVCDAAGERLLGVQILGEGATELIHVGQMAMVGGLAVDAFVDNVLNFPTLAEAYRVAALDVAGQVARRQRAAA